MASARIARLAGHVDMRATLSGVTEAPSEMPRTILAHCPRICGTRTGRRASAAIATEMIAPESQPAGNFASPSAAPPMAPITRVSTSRRSVWRSDGDGAISTQSNHETLHGGFELLGVAREAQAQEAVAGGTKRAAGRKPPARLVDQAQREATRIALALDREEQIKRALRRREAAARDRGERPADDIAAAPRASDLMRHEALAAIE